MVKLIDSFMAHAFECGQREQELNHLLDFILLELLDDLDVVVSLDGDELGRLKVEDCSLP